MNYYPFHIGDYAAHTRGLSLMEDLAYRRLLDAYYLAEHPFNMCSTDIARCVGMIQEHEAVEYVLNKFFEHTEAGFVHHRADQEISKAHAKKEAVTRAGKASASARFNKRSTPVQQTLNISSNQEPITKDSTSVGFTEFWKAYPNKTGKGAAEKSWEKQKPDLATVLAALSWQTKQDAWTKDQGKFIPHPSTYLNQRRWEDEQPVTKPKATGGLNL
jgi:uncharacterized protein YdaU (DUF1376 family)